MSTPSWNWPKNKEDSKRIQDAIHAQSLKYQKEGDTSRNANEGAAMAWDMHVGRIDKEDWPEGWKDPYANLDNLARPKTKAAKAKSKTAKAKAKK